MRFATELRHSGTKEPEARQNLAQRVSDGQNKEKRPAHVGAADFFTIERKLYPQDRIRPHNVIRTRFGW